MFAPPRRVAKVFESVLNTRPAPSGAGLVLHFTSQILDFLNYNEQLYGTTDFTRQHQYIRKFGSKKIRMVFAVE